MPINGIDLTPCLAEDARKPGGTPDHTCNTNVEFSEVTQIGSDSVHIHPKCILGIKVSQTTVVNYSGVLDQLP